MKGKLKGPSPTFVISLVALFMALGGTTYAAVNLPRHSVGTAQLKNGAVTKTKIQRKTLKALTAAVGPRGPRGLPGPKGDKGDPTYKRTIVVSPVGTNAQNGAALLAAVASVNPTATSPYLITIEPGTYDLGSHTLGLKAFLDVEGSGLNTHVTSASTATIQGANYSEIRDLDVLNSLTAASTPAIGINGGGSHDFRLQDVHATGYNTAGLGVGLLVNGGNGNGTMVVNSTVTGDGGAGMPSGVLVQSDPSNPGFLQMDNSVANGYGFNGGGVGVNVVGAQNAAQIRWSDVWGAAASIRAADSSIYVGFSILEAPVSTSGGGGVTCGDDLNYQYAPLSASCT
jgi:hypothetical protein